MLIDHIFNDIEEAWDYILVEEREALNNDKKRKQPPLCLEPFSKPIPTKIPVDSIDYMFNGYFNKASMDRFILTRLMSGRYALKPNLSKRKFLFRGQGQYFERCVPNLFRSQKDYFITELVMGQEMQLLMLTHPLVQLLDLGINLGGRLFRFEMNLFGLTQHYYNKTTFLDLTSDPEIASFFAVTEYDPITDTYKPIIDNTKEGVLYYYNLDIDRDFKPGFGATSQLTTIGLQIFPRSGRQKGFLLDIPKDENFNDYPQITAVKFRQNARISQEIFDSNEGGKRLFPTDILEKHWKQFNKDKEIVSEAAVRLNHYFNKESSLGYLKDRLTKAGFKIGVDKPSFTNDELHEYYQDIKNGFWEQFCKQMFFPGDEQGKLMQSLLNAEYEDEYSWAFQSGKSHVIDYKQGFLLKQYEDFLK